MKGNEKHPPPVEIVEIVGAAEFSVVPWLLCIFEYLSFRGVSSAFIGHGAEEDEFMHSA